MKPELETKGDYPRHSDKASPFIDLIMLTGANRRVETLSAEQTNSRRATYEDEALPGVPPSRLRAGVWLWTHPTVAVPLVACRFTPTPRMPPVYQQGTN